MKYSLILLFLSASLFFSYSADTLRLSNYTIIVPTRLANKTSLPKADTIPLSLKGSKYSEKNHVLTIVLPQEYKNFKKTRAKLEKMKIEVDIKISAESTKLLTLEYSNIKIRKIGKGKKKAIVVKVNMANMLDWFYLKKSILKEKEVKEKIIRRIAKDGKNWRLVNL